MSQSQCQTIIIFCAKIQSFYSYIYFEISSPPENSERYKHKILGLLCIAFPSVAWDDISDNYSVNYAQFKDLHTDQSICIGIEVLLLNIICSPILKKNIKILISFSLFYYSKIHK